MEKYSLKYIQTAYIWSQKWLRPKTKNKTSSHTNKARTELSMGEKHMFEIGKKYKIQDLNDIYYTATIIEETENAILFSDLYGQVQGIAKGQIKRWIEVKE